MATTRSRPHGREQARSSSGGVAAEHATKIYAVAITAIVVIVAFLALTSTGHVIDAATQHFMLFYAGVFALIALCASTGLGLIATDRVFLRPGHRVIAQSAHRAASFGAVTFLIIHIVTEILAQRVHVLDAVVPFLSPFRTFYIGLGTIASDLILLLVITGIMRGRFNANGKAWRWRAMHYTAYASFVFGIWHGLLAGRPAKPYVDWSYGLLVAFVLLALVVRIVATSLRPKENLSAPPVEMSANSASAPMRAAAMFAQLGLARGANTARGAHAGGRDRLMVSSTQERVLSAPLGGGFPSGPLLTAPLPAGTGQMYYEPGYEGPARYLGAPRNPVSGPMPRANSGAMPRADSGPMPRAATGPMPRAATGPIPRAATGPIPQAGTGPIPAGNGPMPRAWAGPMPVPGSDHRPASGTGPWPQSGDRSGPMPRAASGPMPRAASGPMPRAATGSQPRSSTGSFPRPGTGPMPRPGTGPMPRAGTGPRPWPTSGPGSGPMPGAGTGPQPWPGSGLGSGPMPRAATGPIPRPQTGPQPGPGPGRCRTAVPGRGADTGRGASTDHEAAAGRSRITGRRGVTPGSPARAAVAVRAPAAAATPIAAVRLPGRAGCPSRILRSSTGSPGRGCPATGGPVTTDTAEIRVDEPE